MRKTLVILATLALLPTQSWGGNKTLTEAGLQKLAEEAPDFTLIGRSGEKITLRANRGRVVIIHIWATWCKPCKDEFPLFERLYNEFKEKGVVFLPIAIDTNTDIKEVSAHAKGMGADFEVYLASQSDITAKYWSWGVPATYFVDKNGRIVARGLGPKDWGADGVRRFIDTLLNEK